MTPERRARRAELQRGYLERNREAVNARKRTAYAANADAVLMTQRAAYAADPQKRRERQRQYVSDNREQVNARKRTAYAADMKADPEKRRAGSRRRFAVRQSRSVSILWSKQNGLCYLCGEPLLIEQAVRDHDHNCCAGRTRGA